MRDYARTLLATVCAFAAVLTAALERLLPSNVSAGIAVFVALVYGSRSDSVSKRFKTDVDRVLEPDDATKFVLFGCVIVGCLVGFWVATPTGAALGVAAALVAVHWHWFK